MTKFFTLFSAVVLSALVAQASVVGNWSSDHFIYSDSDGATSDDGAGVVKVSLDGDQLMVDWLGQALTVRDGELYFQETKVGTYAENAIVVENMVVDAEANDIYSFSLTLNEDDMAQFTDKYVYGDEPDYFDAYTADLVRAAEGPSRHPAFLNRR